MKKSENFIYSTLIALLCASVLFLTACDDGDGDGTDPVVTIPVLVSQSESQDLETGATLTLKVVATGDALIYQWYKGDAEITGATNAEYTKADVAESDAGDYTCKVSNSAGSVTTTPIAVTVTFVLTPIIDNIENKLYSTTFEIVGDIQDSVEGVYTEHTSQATGLYSKFTIKNKTFFPIRYFVTIEKISMPDAHFAGICIGECINVSGSDLAEKRYFPATYNPETNTGEAILLGGEATTNRDVDSYIVMSAGNIDRMPPVPSTKGQTMLRVTYTNKDDHTDFIRFKVYWNFK